MYRYPFIQFFSVISTLASVVGCIFYFINPVITIFCGAITLINSFLQIVFADQNNFTTEIVTIIIAVVVALIIDTAIIPCISFALCIADLLMLVTGWIFMFFLYKRNF